MRTLLRALSTVALLLSGCSESTESEDLPAGWDGGRSVASFSQAACSGSPLDPGAPPESIEVSTSAGSIQVAYHHAHFRCSQAVEGFVRMGTGTADFLVQPVDMNPSTVARCDCLYEITMSTEALSGATAVTVYRRWDRYGGNPTDPVEIGTASVTVP